MNTTLLIRPRVEVVDLDGALLSLIRAALPGPEFDLRVTSPEDALTADREDDRHAEVVVVPMSGAPLPRSRRASRLDRLLHEGADPGSPGRHPDAEPGPHRWLHNRDRYAPRHGGTLGLQFISRMREVRASAQVLAAFDRGGGRAGADVRAALKAGAHDILVLDDVAEELLRLRVANYAALARVQVSVPAALAELAVSRVALEAQVASMFESTFEVTRRLAPALAHFDIPSLRVPELARFTVPDLRLQRLVDAERCLGVLPRIPTDVTVAWKSVIEASRLLQVASPPLLPPELVHGILHDTWLRHLHLTCGTYAAERPAPEGAPAEGASAAPAADLGAAAPPDVTPADGVDAAPTWPPPSVPDRETFRTGMRRLLGESGRVSAARVADYLDVSLRQLTGALDLRYGGVHARPDSDRVQRRLQPFVRVLESLADVFGGDDAAVRAWLRRPLPDLDGESPLAVMLAGEIGAVETLLENARAGLPG